MVGKELVKRRENMLILFVFIKGNSLKKEELKTVYLLKDNHYNKMQIFFVGHACSLVLHMHLK